MDSSKKIFIFFLLIFLSRLPFIYPGYGAEEDAWGLAVNAYKMESTGMYEVSRLPGHPVQEYIYSWIPVKAAEVFNVLTAVCSTAGLFFFFMILKRLAVKSALLLTVILAFIPVFYINSANAMDYTWALSFAFAGWYFVLIKKYFVAGFFVALAIGCRITSGAFVLPLLYSIFSMTSDSKDQIKKNALLFLLSVFVFSILVFIPVFKNYGIRFFGYVNQFGYPPLIKTMFKSTFGVFGFAGFLFTCYLVVISIFNMKKPQALDKPLLVFCLCGFFIFLLAYIAEPHKSAYLIPLLPFLLIFLSRAVSKKLLKIYLIILFINCFTTGINLADENRSSSPSAVSITKKISGQLVSFDVLKGPVIDDHQKRIKRIEYANRIVKQLLTIKKPSMVICGYWLNTILIEQKKYPPHSAELVYYAGKETLELKKKNGTVIYYLPGQEIWNDRSYGSSFTTKYASLLFN